jgi:hypothetical protein
MGEVLQAEGRWRDALQTYLEVLYLDLNGIPDCEASEDAAPVSGGTAPSCKSQTRASQPVVVERCGELIDALRLSRNDLWMCFQRAAERAYGALHVAVAPEAASQRVKATLGIRDWSLALAERHRSDSLSVNPQANRTAEEVNSGPPRGRKAGKSAGKRAWMTF